jgi:CcmD family protein
VSSGAQFVVAAYAVVLFGLVMYVVVLGLKTARIARELELVSRLLDRSEGPADDEGPPGERPTSVGARVEPGDR